MSDASTAGTTRENRPVARVVIDADTVIDLTGPIVEDSDDFGRCPWCGTSGDEDMVAFGGMVTVCHTHRVGWDLYADFGLMCCTPEATLIENARILSGYRWLSYGELDFDEPRFQSVFDEDLGEFVACL